MILQQPFAIPSFGFLPTKIAGCKLWLKADAITGLVNSDPVGTWPDSSGTGNDVTQATAGSKPLYKTNIINGLPTVLFDGSDDFMASGAVSSTTSNSQFIVTQPTLNTASQNVYACMAHFRNNSFMVAKLSTNFWGTFCVSDYSSTNALTSGSNYLLECTTPNAILYQRGVQVGTPPGVAVVGPVGATTIGVGKDLVNVSRQYAGHIAEIIFYDTVLSSGNRILVENYLISKYAL